MAKPESSNKRQAAEIGGRRAERIAAWWLRFHGYRILATRFRSGAGEIDLIARRGAMLAFVEVKRRNDADDALLAVGVTARKRIARAADLWIARNPRYNDTDRRFDVIAVVPGRLPRHFRSVFDTEGRSW